MDRRPIRLVVLTCVTLVLTAAAYAAAPARRAPAGADRNAAGNSGTGNGNKKPAAAATFEVYQDKGGEYRWRLRVRNSQILAVSADGYKEKRSVLSAIESVRKDVADAPVEEQSAAASGDAKNGKSEATPAGAKVIASASRSARASPRIGTMRT